MQVDKAPEIYAYALSGVPGSCVQKATGKIIRGEYEINRGFVPTPPEFAAIARAEARILREDKTRLMEKLESMGASQKAEKVSEEGKARIRAMLAMFRTKDAARKAYSVKIPEAMDVAMAEYFEHIMALRDAPEVTAEQAAFRRRIRTEIEGARTSTTETVRVA